MSELLRRLTLAEDEKVAARGLGPVIHAATIGYLEHDEPCPEFCYVIALEILRAVTLTSEPLPSKENL